MVLQREVQTVHQTEEVGVAVGSDAVGSAQHLDIGLGISVAAELRQHIGRAFNVVDDAIVTTVIERAVIDEFQTGKAQASTGVCAFTFSGVRLNVEFSLTIAGQHIVDLRFAF